MAFTTEFVMGAGGAEVEEIPVSMSGGGGSSSTPTVYPLATVDAGSGALVIVSGSLEGTATTTASRPHLKVGTVEYDNARNTLSGPATAIITNVTGTAQVAILARNTANVTFTGTVYMVRL